MATVIESYRFSPDHLRSRERVPGISAFMRIKNGAAFLEPTIRSHIDHFDEIVAVYNQCTDATPDILERLAQEYGAKLRVFHYLPRVFPPGSEGHRREPPDSPHSLVAYYNLALSLTKFRVVTKLDDDHVAMPERLAGVASTVRQRSYALGRDMLCVSGINLMRDASGGVGIRADEPFAGAGDHWFFEVGADTYFVHDRRFERLRRGGRRRIFADFTYWHMKLLKPGAGFEHLETAVGSRYAKHRARATAARAIALDALSPPRLSFLGRALPLGSKTRLIGDRWRMFRQRPPNDMPLV